MSSKIRYLNTDLDLKSDKDLSELAVALEQSGVSSLFVGQYDDKKWHATFETDQSYREPDPNIEAMVLAIESLLPMFGSVWEQCEQREFNIGYNCGAEPWAFNQGLNSNLLGRVAALGASIRITIYPKKRKV